MCVVVSLKKNGIPEEKQCASTTNDIILPWYQNRYQCISTFYMCFLHLYIDYDHFSAFIHPQCFALNFLLTWYPCCIFLLINLHKYKESILDIMHMSKKFDPLLYFKIQFSPKGDFFHTGRFFLKGESFLTKDIIFHIGEIASPKGENFL